MTNQLVQKPQQHQQYQCLRSHHFLNHHSITHYFIFFLVLILIPLLLLLLYIRFHYNFTFMRFYRIENRMIGRYRNINIQFFRVQLQLLNYISVLNSLISNIHIFTLNKLRTFLMAALIIILFVLFITIRQTFSQYHFIITVLIIFYDFSFDPIISQFVIIQYHRLLIT